MPGCHECGRAWVHYAELVIHNRGPETKAHLGVECCEL